MVIDWLHFIVVFCGEFFLTPLSLRIMKNLKISIIVFISYLSGTVLLKAQSVGDYRTISGGAFSNAGIWETYTGTWGSAATPPPGSGSVTILVAHAVVMDAGVTMSTGKSFTVNGTIEFPGTAQIAGTGTFVLAAGSTFITANANGVFGTSSSVKNTLSVTFNTLANFEFNSNVAQTANLQNPSCANVIISNTGNAIVTFSNLALSGNLNIVSGFMHFTTNLNMFAPILGLANNITCNSTAAVTFQGSALGCFLPASITALNGLNISRTSGNVDLLGNLSVTTLSFTSGILQTNNYTLTVNASIINGSTTAYVTGKLRRAVPAGPSLVFFPLGLNSYDPITVGTVSSGTSILEVNISEAVPAGTPDGLTQNGVMLDRFWNLKVIGTNNITSLTSMTVGVGGASPTANFQSRIGLSLTNTALSYNSIGGKLSGTNLQSLRLLTTAQRNDLTSVDGLFVGISSLQGIPKTAGVYCIGPAASYTPPAGSAYTYINGASPYQSLRHALYDLNDIGVDGNTIFELQNDLTDANETFPISVYYEGTSTTQAEFRVRNDLTGQLVFDTFVNGGGQGPGIFNYDNADYVHLNGTKANILGTQGIRIQNTCMSFCTGIGIQIENDATHNTFTGLLIEANTAPFRFDTYTGVTGCDYSTIQYCKLTRQNTSSTNGPFAVLIDGSGGSIVKQNNTILQNNEVYDCGRGFTGYTGGLNGKWEIRNNHFYMTTTAFGMESPVALVFASDTGSIHITGNYVGGSEPFALGTPKRFNTSLLHGGSGDGAYKSEISNNVIKNIVQTASSITGIFASGLCAFDILNNTIGDPNTPNSIDALPGASVVFRGIQCNYGAISKVTNISGNIITNIRLQDVNAVGTNVFIEVGAFLTTNGGTVNVTNNKMSNFSDAGKNGLTCITSLLITGWGGSSTNNFSGNVIESISRPNVANPDIFRFFAGIHSAAPSTFYGNRIGNFNNPNDIVLGTRGINVGYRALQGGANCFNNDTIANINFTGTNTDNAFIGFSLNSNLNVPQSISNNVIKNITLATTKSNTEIAVNTSVAMIGIYSAGLFPTTFENNTITGMSLTTTAAVNPMLIGIDIANSGGSSAFTCNNNHISNLLNSANGTTDFPIIMGMRFSVPGTFNAFNNTVSIINNGNSNAVKIYGIYDISGFATRNYNHNTIAISGTGSNTATSAAFWKTSTGTINLKNNIFYNSRTGGTGKHYAMVNQNGTGAIGTTWNCNYNNLYSANPLTVGAWPLATDKTFATWKTVSGDTNSKNTDVRFQNILSDLHLITTTNCNLDNTGSPVVSVTNDMDLQSRSVSTPDIGADEFSYDPTWAQASSNSIICSPPQSLEFSTTDNTFDPFTYAWSGPSSFTSALAGPVITNPTNLLNSGTYSVTVTDVLGCASSPATSLSIVHEPPVITCIGNISTVNSSGNCGAVVNFAAPSVTGFPAPVLYYSHSSGSFFPVGPTVVTVSAVNDCDSVSCDFTMNIIDNELPVIVNCPDDTIVTTDAGECSAVVDWVAPSATDNCAIQSFTSDHNIGDTFLKGITIVTYTATDVNGNDYTCSFSITVNDEESPVFDFCPQNITAFNDTDSCGALVSWLTPLGSDNCAIHTLTGSNTSGEYFTVGMHTVNYTATDADGNSAVCSFEIEVIDNTLPVFVSFPSNSTSATQSGTCSTQVSWISPTVSDNCGIFTLTSTHAAGSVFPLGNSTVTYTVTDIHGNSKDSSFTITVVDMEAPVLSCPANTTASCEQSLLPAQTGESAAIDNCDNNPLITFADVTVGGPCSGNYIINRTWTATDNSMNSMSCLQVITITDTIPPVIACAGDTTVSANNSGCSANVTLSLPLVSDNCGIPTISNNAPMTFPIGVTLVTWTVTDACGNNSTCEQFVTVINSLTVASVFTPVLCNGDNSSVSVSASGGVWPYSGTGNFTQSAGTIFYTINDAIGCSAEVEVTITEPSELVAASLASSVLCNGGNATVSVTASGGTAPYTGTGTFSEGAGTYSYTVTDANGCTAQTSVTINEPALIVTASNATTILCNGGISNVTITATGGMAPYSGTGNFTALAGNSTYVVTDDNGCTSTISLNIIEPDVLSITASATAIFCAGDISNVTIAASGGTAPYIGTGIFSETAGTYSYSISDSNGCTANTTFTISEPNALTASASATAIQCNGDSALITINASGGTAPYSGTGVFTSGPGTFNFTVSDSYGCSATTTVSVNGQVGLTVSASYSPILCHNGTVPVSITATGGMPPYSGTGTFVESAGSYFYIVTDASGCSAVASVNLVNPPMFLVSSTITPILCNGDSAILNIIASGGTLPYSGTGIFTISGGNYSYTVTDINGCTGLITGIATEPDELVVSYTATDINCFDGTSTIVISAAGGSAPYNGTGTYYYKAGTYTFTVIDANGCIAVVTVVIGAPSLLISTTSATTIACAGGTATVTISAAGGTVPYSGTGSVIVTSGTYTYTVTDFNGCTSQSTIVVTQPDALLPSYLVTPVLCYSNQAVVTISAEGGTGPYIGTGNFAADPGISTFTITDANGCQSTLNVTINSPDELIATAVASNASCNSCADGSVTISQVSGGTPPYSFTNLTGTLPGSYCINVADANNCIVQACAIVQASGGCMLSCSTSQTNATYWHATDGTATAVPSGGVAPYTYSWNTDPQQSTQTAVNLNARTSPVMGYTVIITDANGCSTTCNVIITEPAYSCGNLNEYTDAEIGGWGAPPNGNNITNTWLYPHFATVFPNGIVIGGFGRTLTFGCAKAITNFLPASATPVQLNLGNITNPVGSNNPTYSNPMCGVNGILYKNSLASKTLALTMNVEFDKKFPAFSPNFTVTYGDLIYTSAPFAGWTVNEVLAEANRLLGQGLINGQTSTYYNTVVSVISNVVAGINEQCPLNAVIRENITSALNVPLESINIFPNPARSEINVEIFTDHEESLTFEWIDITGRVIQTQNIHKQQGMFKIANDVSHLPAAVYFVHLYSLSLNKVIKIVIE